MILYEVNIQIQPQIARGYEQWLAGHIERMLTMPGFLSARRFREDRPDAPELYITVQYRVESRERLEEYLRNHAANLRQEAIDRFGDLFSISRRILEIIAE